MITEGGPPHGRPAFYLPTGFAARPRGAEQLGLRVGDDVSQLKVAFPWAGKMVLTSVDGERTYRKSAD